MEKLSFEDFKKKDVKEKIEIINNIIKNEKITVGEVSIQVFNMPKCTLSSYMSSQGCKFKGGKYIIVQKNIENNIFESINKELQGLNNDVKKITLNINSELHEELKKFLKNKKILKKQDCVNVAISRFLKDFSKK